MSFKHLKEIRNDYGMDYLNKALPEDEVSEDEGLYTEGDCILHQFYSGNWRQTLRRCVDNGVYWQELEHYIAEKAGELGMERYEGDFFGWFDASFFGEFGASTERVRYLIANGTISA